MSEASTVLVSSKIGPVHLGRDAYVYVRQSTLTQLREHTESLIRQCGRVWLGRPSGAGDRR